MSNSPRSLIALALLLLPVVGVGAQQKDDPFDYRRFLAPPKTTSEFWEAMKFEMEVGRFDLAAQHLRDMLAKKPKEEELVALAEKEGIVAFLRLRLVPTWFTEKRDREKQARDDVDSLIEEMTKAVKSKLTDPKRISLFVTNLSGLPEEAEFARIELAKPGAALAAMPYILEELKAREEKNRGPILDALVTLPHDIIRPLLAALDMDDNVLRENLLDVLRRRSDLYGLKDKGIDVAPALWPLISPVNKNENLRRKAREILAIVFNLRTPDLLPPAITALTEEAERYYYHRIRFSDPRKVALWRWDEKTKKVVDDSTFNPTTAEKYLGMRYARQALQIDPTNRAAQLVMLNLLIDKGYEPPTADRPLGTLKPTIAEDLLLTLNPDLLNQALETALRDERTPIVLPLVKALGKLGDVRTLTPETSGEPPLVRALHYGDRRVQMAAADAILRIPGSASAQATSRIVEILKLALVPDVATAADRPRILAASSNESYLRDIRNAIEQIGSEAAVALNGREAVKRLVRHADIDAVLLDSTITNLDLTWVLAQLRSDRSLRRLPVLVAAIPEGQAARDILQELRDIGVRIRTLDAEIKNRTEDLARQERRSASGYYNLDQHPVLKDQRKRKAESDARIAFLSERYDQEGMKREERLRGLLEKQKHVFVVSTTSLSDPRLLAAQIDEKVRETGMAPLSKTEKKEYADTALFWLAKMATGDVKGYDVRPVEDAVVTMLSAPDLSEAAVLNAIRILGRLPGGGAQRHLAAVFLDSKRPTPTGVAAADVEPLRNRIRVAAADELLRHMQEYGKPGLDAQRELRDAVETAVKQPGIDANLRDRMTRMVGALRPNDRKTGDRLRDFGP